MDPVHQSPHAADGLALRTSLVASDVAGRSPVRPRHPWLPLTAAPLLVLAACSAGNGAEVEGSEPIPCLLPGASEYKTLCTMDRMASPDGTLLTVHAPDGGFRRLLIVKDGRGVVAAAGAEPVRVEPAGADGIAVTAGDIVYRLPAKVAP